MKKTLIILFALLPLIGFAQAPHDHPKFKENKEKIEAAKIGFITNKLDLTPKQAQKFWPIYNEYSKKKFEIKKSMMQQRKLNKESGKDDKDWEKRLEIMAEMRKQELALEEEYKKKFLKVITAKQVFILYESEKEFIMMLRKKISERRGEHGGHKKGEWKKNY